MVERYDGEPLPPAHPVPSGPPPLIDGQTITRPAPPLPPRELHRARLIAAVVAVIVVAGVVLGRLL